MAAAVHIRPVVEGDCRQLFAWANDPTVRATARSTESITWDGHQAWFTARKASPETRMWIAEDADGTPLGQVRLDRDAAAGAAEVDISVAAEARGRGVGRALLAHAAAEADGWVGRLTSEVRRENAASLALFRAAGYHETGRDDAYVRFERSLP